LEAPVSFSNKKKLQQAVRTYISTLPWKNPVALTLTLKQAVVVNGCRVSLDALHAQSALRHTFNVVDRNLYGNKVRNGKRLPRFAVYEGGDGIRYHYHIMLDVPHHVTVEYLTTLIWTTWRQTQWGYEVMDCTPCDAGWANYITKLGTKSDFGSAIDWRNVVVPT
jgi:hypothetical protein